MKRNPGEICKKTQFGMELVAEERTQDFQILCDDAIKKGNYFLQS